MPVFTDQEGYERLIDPELFTIQFVDNMSESEALNIISNWGCKIVIDQWIPGYYTITIPPGKNLFEAVREVLKLPYVKFAEPAFYGFNDLQSDTYINQEWHLQNTGQETDYTIGNDINIFPAWNITMGES